MRIFINKSWRIRLAISSLCIVAAVVAAESASPPAGGGASAAVHIGAIQIGMPRNALVAALKLQDPEARIQDIPDPYSTALLSSSTAVSRGVSVDAPGSDARGPSLGASPSEPTGIRAQLGALHQPDQVFEEWHAYFASPPNPAAASTVSRETVFGTKLMRPLDDVVRELKEVYGSPTEIREGRAMKWAYRVTGELIPAGSAEARSLCKGAGSPVLDRLRSESGPLGECGTESIVEAIISEDAVQKGLVRRLRLTLWSGDLAVRLASDRS